MKSGCLSQFISWWFPNWRTHILDATYVFLEHEAMKDPVAASHIVPS